METYISEGSKYLKRLSIVVSGDSGSINYIILELRVYAPIAINKFEERKNEQ